MPLTFDDKECMVDMTRLSSASILARLRVFGAPLEPPAAEVLPPMLRGDRLPSLPVSSIEICQQPPCILIYYITVKHIINNKLPVD